MNPVPVSIEKGWIYGEAIKIEKTGAGIDNIIVYCSKTFPLKEDAGQRYIAAAKEPE